MVVAVLKVHLAFGFFMNWVGTQPGEGFEFHALALAIAVAVIAKGSGAASVDRAVLRRAAADRRAGTVGETYRQTEALTVS